LNDGCELTRFVRKLISPISWVLLVHYRDAGDTQVLFSCVAPQFADVDSGGHALAQQFSLAINCLSYL
jgi:hypothetical protein